jgi:hypothetical protein
MRAYWVWLFLISGRPPMVTDAECVRGGGKVFTYQAYGRNEELHTFSVCRRGDKDGKACRGDADCGDGRCYCTGPLDRPNPFDDPKLRALDGKPAAGRCEYGPINAGQWRCLVKGGKATLHGIIVD